MAPHWQDQNRADASAGGNPALNRDEELNQRFSTVPDSRPTFADQHQDRIAHSAYLPEVCVQNGILQQGEVAHVAFCKTAQSEDPLGALEMSIFDYAVTCA